jgi:hypothetical protein
VLDRRRFVVGGVTVGILVATLTPTGGRAGQEFSFCLGCGWRWLSDGLLNIGLFVPLGVAAGWHARSFWRVLLAGALLSTLIELTQTIVPGRDPQLADIIFNTIGAACGAIIGYRPRAWLVPSTRAAVRFLIGAIVVIALVIAGTAALLAPDIPVGSSGQLATIAALAKGEARFRFNAPPVAPPITLTPLTYLYDSTYTEWLAVGRVGNDAVVRYRSRARLFGLDQPDYVAKSAFGVAAPGDSLLVDLWRESRHWCIRAGARQDCRVGPTVGRGWSVLLYPDAIGQRWGSLIDACWAAALLIPLGFWTRRQTVIVTIAGAAILFALAPAMIGLVPTPLGQWLGGAIGAAAGYAASLLVHARPPSPPS